MFGLGNTAFAAQGLDLIHPQLAGHAQCIIKAPPDQGDGQTKPWRLGRLLLIRTAGKRQDIACSQQGCPQRSNAIHNSNLIPHPAAQHPTQVVLLCGVQNECRGRAKSSQPIRCNQKPSEFSHRRGTGCPGGPPRASPR